MKRMISFFLATVLLFGSIFVLPVTALPTEESLKKPTVCSVSVNVAAHLTVSFTVAVPEGTTSAGLVIKGERVRGERQENGRYLVTYGPIYMSGMSDVIKVKPWSYTGKKLLDNEDYAFSVTDYAARLLAEPMVDPKLRRVLVALLNYGAATQRYFEHSIYNLANAYLSPADRITAPGSYTDELGRHGGGEGSGISFSGAGILLDEYLRFNFAMECENERYTGADCRMQVSLTPDFSQYVSYAVTAELDGKYFSRTDEIPYDALRERIYVRFVLPNGEHSETVSYSVEAYANNMASKEIAPDNVGEQMRLELMHCMMALSDALAAYQNK